MNCNRNDLESNDLSSAHVNKNEYNGFQGLILKFRQFESFSSTR